MMQRWREKLKYIEAGLIVTSLIMFVVCLYSVVVFRKNWNTHLLGLHVTENMIL